MLAVLFGSQAVANSQIKEDFAYAFGSSEGLDSGSITLLSPREMDETEGLFIAWLIRLAPKVVDSFRNAFSFVKLTIKRNAWLRYDQSFSRTAGFKTKAIKWGSNDYYRDKKLQNAILRDFNKRLRETKIPLNTWRTNDPGHLHIRRLPDETPPSPPPASRSSAMSNRRSPPKPSPDLHDGSGGVISEIDWETMTAEDLLTGKYDGAILTEAAAGPTGDRWGMEEITEKQAILGLSILAFVVEPENNADIDIPWQVLRKHYRMAVHLRRNPRKNDRAARMVRLGLKHLEYIIGQHAQDYHPDNREPSDGAVTPTPSSASPISVSMSEALPEESTSAPASPSIDRNTYLPIQAHWWMHEFSSR